MLKVLSEAGNYVKNEVWHALIVVISNASDLHGYTVRSLFKAFQTSGDQESLVRVAVWCIGEYGEMLVNNIGMLDIEDPVTVTESDAVDVLEIVMKRHTSEIDTREMSLIALLKLSSRFPACSERIRDIIVQNKGSLVLELQQRSIEFNSIVAKHQNIRSALVERMPVLDETTYSGKRPGTLPATGSTSTGASFNIPNGVAKSAAAPLVNLLDLDSDDAPPPSSSGGDFLNDLLGVGVSPIPSMSGTSKSPTSGTDVLLDLLSIGTPPAQNNFSNDLLSMSTDNGPSVSSLDRTQSLSSQVSSPPGAAPMMDLLDSLSPTVSMTTNSLADMNLNGDNGPVHQPIVAFQSKSLKIMFSFSKEPGNPQTTLITATFTNLSSNDYTNFLFQAAVPKFVQLQLETASSNILPASGNGSITQTLRVTNSQQGQKALAMRLRVSYKVNGEEGLELGQVNNFPRGL